MKMFRSSVIILGVVGACLAGVTKREAEAEADAEPQFLAGAAPYVNDGPVAGPLTAAFGDLVATERGLRPISLEGFSEDLNEDGFVDPIAQAVPVAAPLVAAPAPLAPTTFAAPAPLAPATFAAPAPLAPTAFAAPAPLAASPLAAFAAPAPFVPPVLSVASPVHHAPVVKAVVDTPATVEHEVHAAPLVHHFAPHFYTSQPAFGHVVKPFVQF